MTQSVQDKESMTQAISRAQTLLMSIAGTLEVAPKWWSHARDEWLFDFWHQVGNDLLAGAVSTMTAKVASADWYVEGPEELAMMYRNILLNQSDFGSGWDSFVAKWVQGYLSRDLGGLAERLRTSINDRVGPALGFAHLDESQCYLTGNDEYPVIYTGGDKPRKLHRANVMRIVDMPSPRDRDLGTGFCSISRAISTASIMMDIVRYKRERLSDLPPAAILFINNMTSKQWEDITARYDSRQRNENNRTWRDMLVAFGLDPEFPVEANLFELSQLPEHYDEKTATEVAVYTFALAFRADPREFWPVSAGPLGTATEATIQHRKAKAKGEGVIYTAIERQMNSPLSLPSSVRFKFDFRDDEDDLQHAEVARQKIQNVRLMWEASPNRQPVEEGKINEGIISTEQARYMLAMDGIIPDEFVEGITLDNAVLYDTRNLGPVIRTYRSGRTLKVPW